MEDYVERLERRRSDGHQTLGLSGGAAFKPSPPKVANVRAPTKPKNSIIQQQRQSHRQLVAAATSLRSILDNNNDNQRQPYPDYGRTAAAAPEATQQRPRFINNGVESFDDNGLLGTQVDHHTSYTDRFLATKLPSKPAMAKTARPGVKRPAASTVVVRRSEMQPAAPRRQQQQQQPYMTSAAAVHRTTGAATWSSQQLGGSAIAEGYRGYWPAEEEEGEEEVEEEEEWPAEGRVRPHPQPHQPEVVTQYMGRTIKTVAGPSRPMEPTVRHPPPLPVSGRQQEQQQQAQRRKSLEERDLRNETPETVLGEGTKLKGGELVVRGVLRVDGCLEADRVSANGLHVTAKGHLRADVRGMEVVLVEGTVVGDVAAQRIHLCQQGTVHGNLTCRSLQVDSGCMIVGQAHVGDMRLEQRAADE